MVLYHGTDQRNITHFEPRALSFRDKNEGSAVFATPLQGLAACFMVRPIKVECGRFNDTVFYVAVRKEFEDHDRGGAMYALPADTFRCVPDVGMGELEWVSRERVEPLSKKEYDFSLEALLEHGVQVYLVEPEQIEAIRASEDHGYSILKSLDSENKKCNRNIKEL
jgi:hypothetical protein